MEQDHRPPRPFRSKPAQVVVISSHSYPPIAKPSSFARPMSEAKSQHMRSARTRLGNPLAPSYAFVEYNNVANDRRLQQNDPRTICSAIASCCTRFIYLHSQFLIPNHCICTFRSEEKNKMKWKSLGALLMVLALLLCAVPAAVAAPPASDDITGDPQPVAKQDNKPDPLTTHQLELKEKALEAKLNGKAYGKTHEVARGQYVELAREGEGALWTVLGEFADLPHNTMPQPDRAVDNTTHLGAGLQPRLLHESALQRRPRRQLDAQLLHRAVVQPLHGARRCDRLGPGPAGACLLRRQSRLERLDLPGGFGQRLVRRPDRGRQDACRDQRVPEPVRRLGSL